jgi:glycosyltransferase involved in cell wall biosynthesis
MPQPFFSIVTPVFNGDRYIEETIKSVINQTIDDYEYIIVDNKSIDNTGKIINRYSSKIDKIISEKDNGMYDALQKGFRYCNGKYFYWLNSDDFLKNSNVLRKLKEFLIKNSELDWVIGKTNFRYEKYNFNLELFPYQYPQSIVKNGYAHNCAWGFIQQESTIFSKKLFYDVGGFKKNYKMAGDYYLWKEFSKKQKPVSVNFSIGVQRKWSGQLQNNLQFYYNEMNKKKCKFVFFKLFRFIYSYLIFLKLLILKK